MSVEEVSEHGRIVAPGSSGVRLTEREEQVAELVSYGWSHKKTARALGIHPSTVSAHVSTIASKIPGEGSAKLKVAVWYLGRDI